MTNLFCTSGQPRPRSLKIFLSTIGFTISVVLGLTFMTGCAESVNSTVIKECVLPDDQRGTLSGKWRNTPIPIAFHEGDFTSSEMFAMVQAADTWNDFYAQSLGLHTVDYGNPNQPRTSNMPRPSGASLCSGNIVQGSSYSGNVVIYKNSTWPFPDQPSIIALTSYCRTNATPLPYFYIQIIDINYQNFFSSGRRQPDLQTIVLHELGHMLGLNHTCNSTASTGVPSCSDSQINPLYVRALMYPNFTFDRAGAGEQKRSLNENDQGRANCLYTNYGNE